MWVDLLINVLNGQFTFLLSYPAPCLLEYMASVIFEKINSEFIFINRIHYSKNCIRVRYSKDHTCYYEPSIYWILRIVYGQFLSVQLGNGPMKITQLCTLIATIHNTP